VRAHVTDGPRRLAGTSLVAAVIVPLVVAGVGVWATTRRLARTDVA
jgi:hypothetical protein